MKSCPVLSALYMHNELMFYNWAFILQFSKLDENDEMDVLK